MNTEWTEEDVQKNLDKHLGLDRLVFWPNSVLNKPCEEVTVFDQSIADLAEEMWKVMSSADGIGIAAPQIGVLKKIICISTDDQHIKMANPHITPVGTEMVDSQEGCLSFPGIFVKVKRYKEVALTGQIIDEYRHGQIVTYSLTGIAAICAQHETDHVNGITMVDHLSKLKRDIIRKKIEKQDRRHIGKF